MVDFQNTVMHDEMQGRWSGAIAVYLWKRSL